MSFPSEVYDADYWDKGIGSNYGRDGMAPYTKEYYLPAKRKVANEVIKMIGIPKSALCLGAGRGFQVIAFRQFAIDARGVDISEYAINTAPPEVKSYLILGDVSDNFFMMKNFIINQYELVTCFDVFEHIKVPELYNAIYHAIRIAEKFVMLNVPVKNIDDEPDESKTSTDKTHVSIYTPVWWLDKFTKIGKPFNLELRTTKVTHTDETYNLFAVFAK